MSNKRYEIIDRIIAAELLIYIAFMFITKGEAIRNILIFSSFFLWLSTINHRSNLKIFREPVSILFFLCILSTAVSAVFSIDPVYSFFSLREDPLKALLIFCLVSTVLSDKDRLKTFIYISLSMLIFIISAGYYSYWAYDLPQMKPLTTLRHSWHSRFAVDINTLLPFTSIIILIRANKILIITVIVTILTGILGIILSGSRGGMAGFIGISAVWLAYFIEIKKLNFKYMLSGLLIVLTLLSISYVLSPAVKAKFTDKENLLSLSRRTEIWRPLIAAASQKPLFGWGYGSKIFERDQPFENTSYRIAPLNHDPAFRSPHNSFLRILFHQGKAGFIFYVLLMLMAVRTFWNSACKRAESFSGYILIACTSILTGTFIINAMVENLPLQEVAFILAIGLAAKNSSNEDSNN